MPLPSSGLFSGNTTSLLLTCEVTKDIVSLCGPAWTEREKGGLLIHGRVGFTRYSTGGSAVMLIDFYSINKATRLAASGMALHPTCPVVLFQSAHRAS